MIDESHVTVPQIHGMYEGDMTRKETLVEFGFRLPSARWTTGRSGSTSSRSGSTRWCTCRPRRGPTSCEVSTRVVEQIVRPTGLVDPEVEIRPTRGQVDDLIEEIRAGPSATSASW